MSKGLGYIPLDPLVHSLAWVRRERERELFQAEATQVYKRVARATETGMRLLDRFAGPHGWAQALGERAGLMWSPSLQRDLAEARDFLGYEKEELDEHGR